KEGSRDVSLHPSLAKPRRKILPETAKGGEAPEGAIQPWPHRRMRLRALRKRARLSALHRGARRSCDPSAQPRAALPGITGCKREDPPRRQCSEHLAGRSLVSDSAVRTVLRHPRMRTAESKGH